MPQDDKASQPKALVFVSQNSTHTTRQVGHGIDSRKQVREHAAKVSAAKRLATIAKRKSEDRSVFHQSEQPSSSRESQLPSSIHTNVATSKRPQSMAAGLGSVKGPSRKYRSRRTASSVSLPGERKGIVPPLTPPDAHHHRRLYSLIDYFFGRALSAANALHIAYDAELLNAQAFTNRITNERKLQHAVVACTTDLSSPEERDFSSQSLLQWQGYNLINYLQAALGQGYAPKPATIEMLAMLAGWEFEFGEREACGTHLHNLSKLTYTLSDTAYAAEVLDIGSLNAPDFGHHCMLPTGFEFYHVRNLLPRTLLCIVGTIAMFDSRVSMAAELLRQLQLAVQTCRPEGDVALRALSEEALSVQVAKHVQISGCILGDRMFQAHFSDVDVPTGILTTDAIADGDVLSSAPLIGTVYDEVLLWCLWTMCCSSSKFDRINREHLHSIRQLMARLQLTTLESLAGIMAKYSYPQWLKQSIQSLWVHLEQNPEAIAPASEG